MKPTDKIKKQKAFENPFDRNAYDLRHSKIKKQAEELMHKKYDKNPYAKSNEVNAYYSGILDGVELATQWNSPDEKPENIDKKSIHKRTGDILILCNNEIFIGYYNYATNQYEKIGFFTIHSYEIDGWQYLPKIEK